MDSKASKGNNQSWDRIASSAVHEAGQVMERQLFGEDLPAQQFLEYTSEQLIEAKKLEDQWARGFTTGALSASRSIVTSFSSKVDNGVHEVPKVSPDNRAEVVGIHLARLRLSSAQWAAYIASPTHKQGEPVSYQLGLDKGGDYTLDRAQSVFRIRLERRLEECYKWSRGKDSMVFNALAWIALYTPRPGGVPDDLEYYQEVVENIRNDELITEEPQKGGFSEVYLSSQGLAKLRELGSVLFEPQSGMPVLKLKHDRYG